MAAEISPRWTNFSAEVVQFPTATVDTVRGEANFGREFAIHFKAAALCARALLQLSRSSKSKFSAQNLVIFPRGDFGGSLKSGARDQIFGSRNAPANANLQLL